MIATSFFTDKLISNSPILACPNSHQESRNITTWQVSTDNTESSSLDYEILLRNTKVSEEKYVFVKPGIFQQYANGTANLLGVIIDIDNPHKIWNINIWFQISRVKNDLKPNTKTNCCYQIHKEYPPVLIGGGDYLGQVLHLYENNSGLELSLSQKKNSFEILMSGRFGCVGMGKNCILEMKTNLAEVINVSKSDDLPKASHIPFPRVNNTNLLNFDSYTCELANI